MSPFAGGNGNFFIEDGGFVQVSGVLLFHANGTAAAADISGQVQQFFYSHQLHVLITGGFRGLFQVQLTAHRNAKNMNPCPFAPGHQGFENLLFRHSYSMGGMDAAEVIFIKVIVCFPAGDLRLLDKSYRIGFRSHIITIFIITQLVNSPKVSLWQRATDVDTT